MIQRVQTLYLIGAIVLLVLMFIWPVAVIDGQLTINMLSLTAEGINIPALFYQITIVPGIILILSTIILFVSIFLFKKRNVQIRFVRYAQILTLIIIAFFVLIIILALNRLEFDLIIQPGISAILIALSFVFQFMAIGGIKKDEKLVRATDRLR